MNKSIKKEHTFIIDVDDERGDNIADACLMTEDEGKALAEKLNKVANANDTFTGMYIDYTREMTDEELNYLIIMGIIYIGQPENPIAAIMEAEEKEMLQ